MKKVATLQSNYIPWKGYFDLISYVDEFIFYDDMQYTKRDWRNRNLIKTPIGLQWLTIPVKVSGKFHQKINQVEIDGEKWSIQHWKTISQNYIKAKYFQEICDFLSNSYIYNPYSNLSSFNIALIIKINEYLGIKTKISNSTDYILVPGKSERLAQLCLDSGADVYVSGPAAKEYLELDIFKEANIGVEWFSYEGYQNYPQLWGDFVHHVSILDLLMNCGKRSKEFMRFVK